MSEISYQMVLSTLQTVSIMVGIFYYVMTLRNNSKNQQLALKAQEHAVETREAQLFMQIYSQLNTIESQKAWAEILNMQWDDMQDFRRKYDSTNNPEAWSKRGHIWWSYTAIGHLLEKGLVDPELLYDTLGPMMMLQWNKWKEVIYDTREEAIRRKAKGATDMFSGFEYLYNEMVEQLEKKA